MWRASAVLVLVLVAAAAGQEPTRGWWKFSSPDANLAILFPGEPKVTDAPNGAKEVVFKTGNGKVLYMLRFDPFPARVDPADADAVGRVFDGLKGGLKKSGVTVRSEKQFKLDAKHPALELDAPSETIPDYKIRAVVTEKWLIQIHVGGPKGTPQTEDARLYLNSFLLKD